MIATDYHHPKVVCRKYALTFVETHKIGSPVIGKSQNDDGRSNPRRWSDAINRSWIVANLLVNVDAKRHASAGYQSRDQGR